MAKKRRNRGPRRHHVQWVPRVGGGRALEVDGVVQSVTVDPTSPPAPRLKGRGESWRGIPGDDGGSGGYWGLMLPEGCPRRALIVGLGGGTVAALLARRCPGVEIVGLERDETVLALARAEFELDEIAGLRVVVADAFGEVAARAEREPDGYDYICLDLYEGGRLAPGTLATMFLRQLAALLAPGGTLAVNLLATGRLGEQLHRLRRVFAVVEERRTRGNVVVLARPLDPGGGSPMA
jgi:predicted O-methyltransferase YrrM